MHRFTLAAVVTGFMLGVMFLLFVNSLTSYQSQHCAEVHASGEAKPSDKQPSQPQSEDKEREEEISNYAKSHPRVCGIIGFPRMLIGYMDHHEGFFVGFFTAALFVVTGLLAVFTLQLVKDARDFSEKQIRATDHALAAAQTSAEASQQQALSSIAATRAHVRVIEFSIGQTATAIFDAIQNQRGTGVYNLVGYWEIKNFGQTPAEIYSVAYNAGYVANPSDLIPRSVEARQDRTIGAGSVLDDYSGNSDVHIDHNSRNIIIRGAGHLWFVVDVVYIDVFGGLQNETVYWKLVSDPRFGCRLIVGLTDRRSLADRQLQT